MTSSPLRLLAEDASDLQIISAALQDSVGKAGAIRYQKRKRRFSLELNRFRWEDVTGKSQPKTRIRALLAMDNVTGVKSRGLTKADPELVISILTLEFEPAEIAPAGTVRITLAGDGELEVAVECLDVTLLDADTQWPTRRIPSHEPRKR